jgi:hypothetical protein
MLNFSPQLRDTLSREFWMFNFAPRLRDTLTRGLVEGVWLCGFGVNVAMRPAFAGHAYAWTWREQGVKGGVRRIGGEWLASNTF